MDIIGAKGGKYCLLGHDLSCQEFRIARQALQDPRGETFDTSVLKDGADAATKNDKDSSQPEPGEEIDPTA